MPTPGNAQTQDNWQQMLIIRVYMLAADAEQQQHVRDLGGGVLTLLLAPFSNMENRADNEVKSPSIPTLHTQLFAAFSGPKCSF